MNSNQLTKLMSLVRRTGDRAVVPDNNSDELFVIMDSGNYERLLSHTKSVRGLDESEMMDKINRDIALWRSQNDSLALDWYEKPDDGFHHYNDPGFDRNYSGYDFNGRFGENYWDKTTADMESVEDELEDWNELDQDDDIFDPEIDASLNEGIDLDDLDRDGFIVEGEDVFSDKVDPDEQMYFESTGTESLSNEVAIPEVDITDEGGMGHEEQGIDDIKNSKEEVENLNTSNNLEASSIDIHSTDRFEGSFKPKQRDNIFMEEPLDDIEDEDSFFEEPLS